MDSDVFEEKYEGANILIFHIPRAIYSRRPIYIGQNPLEGTYIRRHEGDYKLEAESVRRMYADADVLTHPLDGKILSHLGLEKDFDATTIRQYRQYHKNTHTGHPWSELSDLEFFKKIGGYKSDPDTGKEGFTLAAVLMFGLEQTILRFLPHYYVDFREKLSTDPAIRWTDRIHPDGTWEANLYQFHRRVYLKMSQSLPVPFKLEGIQRIDDTPAHKALREAIINTIIHSRFNSMHCIVIEHYPDRFVFRNPGSLLVTLEQYFEGGTSICRNSNLQKMFEFIGEGERAGSGIDTIKKGWKENGWAEPTVREIPDPEQVELTLLLNDGIKEESINNVSEPTRADKEPINDDNDPIKELVNGDSLKIYRLIKAQPTLSKPKIAETLNLSISTVKRRIDELVEKEIIKHEGPNKTGYWKTLK
ncbi:MAG: winged helix-turn-helix transcriptional regulator [Bacteroidales bacterium]